MIIQDELNGKIDKTNQNSKDVLQTLENNTNRMDVLVSETTDFADEMERTADEAEKTFSCNAWNKF